MRILVNLILLIALIVGWVFFLTISTETVDSKDDDESDSESVSYEIEEDDEDD